MGNRSCSIIISSFNYERYLAEAVESALAQDGDDVEVIVVDDGSSDGSRDILPTYEHAVTCIFKENGGEASAWNAGFAASEGEVVVFFDSDDVLEPDAVGAFLPHFADPDVVLVHWPLRLVDEDGADLGEINPRPPLADGHLRDVLLAGGPGALRGPVNSGCAWSRRFLTTAMPVPEDVYRIGADSYLGTLAPVFGRIVALERPLARYRQHGTNTASLTAREVVDRERGLYPQRCAAVAAFLAGHGIEVDLGEWERQYYFNRVERTVGAVDRVVPAGTCFVLVANASVPHELFDRRRPVGIELLAGSAKPADDDAVALLPALHRFEYVVFAWSCFWWLEHYRDFARRLLEEFPATYESEDVRIFRRA